MSWKKSLAKFRGYRGRSQREKELAEEIRDHMEREEQENQEAGMSPEEAHYAALRKFGNMVHAEEDSLVMWRLTWLETWVQDFWFAIRLLAKNSGFTAVAVISLAVGIGVNSALFSLADALVLRPLSVPRPEDVVTLVRTSSGNPLGAFSYPDYKDFRDRSMSFEGLVAFLTNSFGFAAKPGELAQMKTGLIVSGNFFQAMDVRFKIGRGFLPEEDQVPGRDAVLVLGQDFWVSQFNSEPSIVGKTVRIDGVEFTVIGVAPLSFTGMDPLLRPAFFVPAMMARRLDADSSRNILEQREDREWEVKGRLKPGVTTAESQAELTSISDSLARTYSDTDKDRGIKVMTELRVRVARDPDDAGLVGMLMALAASVLLVACANLANLQLSRARARTREVAIRLAVGANRMRVIRQLMTENLILALAGGAVSLLVAYAGVAFIRRIQIPTDLPLVLSFRLDERVLLFCFAVTVLSAALFGLAPALQASQSDIVSSLKSADADSSGRQRFWGRKALVVVQVALSLMLLCVATMIYRGFNSVLKLGPGFRIDHMIMMSFDPTLVHYTEQQAKKFYSQLLDRARATSGVKSATLSQVVPMGTEQHSEVMVPEGYLFPKGVTSAAILSDTVDVGYFETMQVRILRGRRFLETDTSGAPLVAVVNDVLAQEYWPNQEAVGKRFRLRDDKGPWVEIVGIAQSAKYLWVGEPPTPYLYLPLAQHPTSRMTLVSESAGDAAGLAAPIRAMVRNLDANQPIYGVRTMSEFYRARTEAATMIDQIVGAMGLVGLLLATVGLYGLMAFTVSRRTREIGIRMAIGADQGAVVGMVLRQGFTLSFIGLVIGLALSYLAEAGVMGLFSGARRDPLAYVMVAPILLAVTMFAAWVPARRASRIDPTRALRFE